MSTAANIRRNRKGEGLFAPLSNCGCWTSKRGSYVSYSWYAKILNSAKNPLTPMHIVNTEEITLHRNHLRWLSKLENRLVVADETGWSRVQILLERIFRPCAYCLQNACTECATLGVPRQSMKKRISVQRTCQASCRSGARWRSPTPIYKKVRLTLRVRVAFQITTLQELAKSIDRNLMDLTHSQNQRSTWSTNSLFIDPQRRDGGIM